jgi:short-subunit dehydrogenase
MTSTTRTQPVLITGCSSGIGRAAALSLHEAGFLVLNVSSMGGRATLPGGAFYHASKYAVEALSDALRMEVAQLGIDVVLIEPGPVATAQTGVAGRLGSSAEDVAAVITQAVRARRPRTRYLINPVARSVVTMSRLLPGRAYDAVPCYQYKLPG